VAAVVTTHLPLELVRRGKVRDVYRLPPDPEGRPRLLIIATDRISAFDVVMPTPIPGKGGLLTDLSARWLRWIESRGLCRTHLLSTDADDIPGIDDDARRALTGRVTIGRACRVIPIECVARGYLDGSGWKEYQQTGTVCGVALPAGLRRADRLPEPIFTPATKAEQGEHDENITIERAGALVGHDLMRTLRDATLAIYRAAHDHALERGVVLADTKFEFGTPEGAGDDAAPILVDEALTPDSSRYWPLDAWRPGGEQPSFDKQYVREHLQRLTDAGAWDKRPPGPELPGDVVEGTLARYREARDRLFPGAAG
jgi:phosphoribosylaminoimidazole-succinocarboxamide synthase